MLKLPVRREFLGQAWTKEDKKEKAPNICLITERFNDVSNIFLHRHNGINNLILFYYRVYNKFTIID